MSPDSPAVTDLAPHTLGDRTAPPQAAPKKSWGWASIGSGLLLLLSKLKLLLIPLKFSKFLVTGLSMATMIWFEARRGGWVFGVGFVLLLLIHELGHGQAIRKAGLNAGWPVFIPFFGALISLKERPPTPAIEAQIAYGGPLAGAVASTVLVAVYLGFQDSNAARVLLGLAHTGFFLNLFNLVPIRPLDGGRVAQIFSKRAGLIGGAMLVALFLVTHSPQLLLIGGFLLLSKLGNRKQGAPALPVEPEVRLTWAVRYFGLAAFLGTAMYLTGRLIGEG